MLGYSHGLRTLALHWAAHDDRVRTVVAIAPYNHIEDAVERLTQDFHMHLSHRTAEKAMALAAARLNLNWDDWSGEAAIRQVKAPVLLIRGGRDTLCRPEDMMALRNAATGQTKAIVVPVANHDVIGFWFHGLRDPVEAWFHEKLKH